MFRTGMGKKAEKKNNNHQKRVIETRCSPVTRSYLRSVYNTTHDLLWVRADAIYYYSSPPSIPILCGNAKKKGTAAPDVTTGTSVYNMCYRYTTYVPIIYVYNLGRRVCECVTLTYIFLFFYKSRISQTDRTLCSRKKKKYSAR